MSAAHAGAAGPTDADRIERVARECAEVGLTDWAMDLRIAALNVARLERLYADHVAESIGQAGAVLAAVQSGKVVLLRERRRGAR